MNRHPGAVHQLSRLSVFGVRLAVVLLAIYWLALFTGTHIPHLPSPDIKNFDKVQHFVAFLGLAFLLAWAVPTSKKHVGTKMVVAFCVAACYGIFDEMTQGLVHRTTDLHDYYADCAGALAGVFTYYWARRILTKRPSPDGGHRQAAPPTRRKSVPEESRHAA